MVSYATICGIAPMAAVSIYSVEGLAGLGGIYNVTDDLPGPPQDVIVEAARLLGVEPPPEQPFETAELTPMARSFYGENKRVSNAKLKAAGFIFAFPTYPASLAQLMQSNSWRG
jgi:hypothetical protein